MRSAVGLLVVGALAIGACGGSGGGGTTGSDAPGGGADNHVLGPADEGIEGVMSIRVGHGDHTEGIVDYGLHPPAGGPHNPVWLNCGFYDQVFPDENVVHDLEHGAVWLAYAETLDPADVEAIHDLVRASDKVVATPYPDLAAGVAVVATAWARQLTLDSVDDPRLERFVVQYEDGSQAPETSVTCTGSPLGSPIP